MTNMDNTFSIVAFDPVSKAFGVAVTTARPAVGNRVPFAQFGVGAIATQANTNPQLGYLGLQELAKGLSAEQVREILIAADSDIQTRQFTIVDTQGRVAAFTGTEPADYKSHLLGNYCAVAGNCLVGQQVLEDMLVTFESSTEIFEIKLLQAIAAGQQAGGDKRGKISSALRVVTQAGHPYLDLRIDKSEQPVDDLFELYAEYKKYFK